MKDSMSCWINIISPISVPAHTNSAMDGYAVRSDDLPAEGVRELRVIGTAPDRVSLAMAGVPASNL